MGTRSFIAKKVNEEKYIAVYCHWDGYPSHNGKILKEHYSNSNRLDLLLSHGDMSVLGSEIGNMHDFENRDDGNVCTFYGRDRGVTFLQRSFLHMMSLLNQQKIMMQTIFMFLMVEIGVIVSPMNIKSFIH